MYPFKIYFKLEKTKEDAWAADLKQIFEFYFFYLEVTDAAGSLSIFLFLAKYHVSFL